MSIPVCSIPRAKASQGEPNPLNILIMGDGFTEEEKDKFLEFIGVKGDTKESLLTKFFEIAPFKYCRKSISFSYAFIPSNRSGIVEEAQEPDNEENKTVFGLHFTEGEQPYAPKPWRNSDVVNIVKQLNLPDDFSYPFGVKQNPEQIWFNFPISKSFGAIGIVANTKAQGGCLIWNPKSIIDFNFAGLKFFPEYGFFTFTMYGYKPDPGRTIGGYQHTFAHELGHLLGLADEYEVFATTWFMAVNDGAMTSGSWTLTSEKANFSRNDVNKHIRVHGAGPDGAVIDATIQSIGGQNEVILDERASRSVNNSIVEIELDEPVQKNVTYIRDPQNMTSDVVRNLKWKSFMLPSQLQDIENGNRLYLFDRIRSEPAVADLLGDNPNLPNKFKYNYVPYTDIPVHWTQLYLIEGANYCLRGQFRTNFECRMRHSSFDNPLEIEGKKVRIAPEFCRVCHVNIREAITGMRNYEIHNFLVNELRDLYKNDIMVRLKNSFDNNFNFVNEAAEPLVLYGPFCQTACARAKIVFDQYVQTGVEIFLTTLHVFMRIYDSIILDPVFYDFYQEIGIGTPYPIPTYLNKDGDPIEFDEQAVNSGFIGHKKDIACYIWNHKPIPNSHMRRAELWFMDGIPFERRNHVYNEDAYRAWTWINRVYAEDALKFKETLSDEASIYVQPIKNETRFFKSFLKYLKNGDLQSKSTEYWGNVEKCYWPLIIDENKVFDAFGI